MQEWFRQAPSAYDDEDDEEDPDDILMRTKTCPACRSTVKHRPVPVFMVKAVSAALKHANPDASGLPQADQIVDPAEDPWGGIFPSSDEDDGSEGSYGTGDEDSDDEDIHGWFTMCVHDNPIVLKMT